MNPSERMRLVNAGDFQGLFIEVLGWDRPNQPHLHISVEDGEYSLEQVARYSGLRVWLCRSVPDARTQRLIDQQVRKVSDARLLIFANEIRQEWRWLQTAAADGIGQPRLALHRHKVGTTNEALDQRLGTIAIAIDERPTLIEVLRKMRSAFDADIVTKRFYDRFIREQRGLTDSIQGISDPGEREWYSSLLMNRLMFIYFLQKKSFMVGETDYLRQRLNRCDELSVDGHAPSFYRGVLVPLFHEGLGRSRAERNYASDSTRDLIGDVPHINGGIFAIHEARAGRSYRDT